MLGNVLPGLRELRAPLAAGYLWLVTLWLVWGDKVPTGNERKAPPLDRLYRLEPIVSSVGLAIVASVAAYVVGSIAIDIQTWLGRQLLKRFPGRGESFRLTEAGERVLRRASRLEIGDLEVRRASVGADAVAADLVARVDVSANEADATRDQVKAIGSTMAAQDDARPDRASRAEMAELAPPVANLDASVRNLLKTRLLAVSQPLHAEVDRPDAEATFRMALWPPLTLLVMYLAIQVSWWWAFALLVPALLVWQWLSLRRQANDALVLALFASEEEEAASALVPGAGLKIRPREPEGRDTP
jgi:hypothetical protein